MEYEEIRDLEDISKKAISKFSNEPYLINFDLKVKFDKSLISTS